MKNGEELTGMKNGNKKIMTYVQRGIYRNREQRYVKRNKMTTKKLRSDNTHQYKTVFTHIAAPLHRLDSPSFVHSHSASWLTLTIGKHC